MKEYIATFYRSNPQLANGGYETTRKVEAKTLQSATKKAQAIASKTNYGGMSLIRVEEATA